MRPYAAAHPSFDPSDVDAAGCRGNARRASAGKLPGPGGDRHSNVRGGRAASRIRTALNKRARGALKAELRALRGEEG